LALGDRGAYRCVCRRVTIAPLDSSFIVERYFKKQPRRRAPNPDLSVSLGLKPKPDTNNFATA
jgi:hypothetical protein